MSATNQLKELLQMPGFMSSMANSQSQLSGNQFNAMSELNDLNTCLPTNPTTIRHNLPNNCTIRVNSSSTKSLFTINALKVAIEGHESTNSDFTKIERLVDFNWEQNRNANWIAVSNRKPLIAYVLHRFTRAPKTSNVSLNDSINSQMIRVMNYETRHRCLAKGVFHEAIADLSFAVNSVSSNSLDISKLAVADFGGNIYIYSLKEENGEIQATQVLAIMNDGHKFESVRLSWCPYIPSEDDDTEVEGDPGLTLAMSCDTRLELFAIDLLQTRYKESIVIEVSALRASKQGYQLIEEAHDMNITSMSIAQEVTAICTTGLDDKIRFYSISLNSVEETIPKVFLKEWNLRNEYQYYERDDHINNFFFLDDFDFLLSQSDPIFWGYGLLCTRKGHIAVINLKDWRPKQCIRLISEEFSEKSSEEIQDFSYRMDLTGHHILAIRRHDAFLLHIRFPHDKEETYEECDPINNETNFDNSYPYISKVSRFQLYSSSLRSFTVKKSIDDNVLIFWITGQSLELCYIDLGSITVEEILPSYELPLINKMLDNIGDSSALNNINSDTMIASNIPNKDMDLMGDISQINGFDGFDISLIKPMNASIDPSLLSMPSPISLQTADPVVSSLNLLPIPPPPPPAFTQSMPFIPPPMPRPESPASKEVQQIFSPSISSMANSNALKTMLSLNTNNIQSMRSDDLSAITNPDSFGALFPSKLPNILKDIVKEEQIVQLKTDLSKEIQDSESRVLQIIDKLDHKLNAKLNSNNEHLISNSKVQTNKIETDLREMKKELKNACKIRNEEFNKIVEKLVNKVMHEMNVIVQKGFVELMVNVNKELKGVTKDFEKQIHTMQSKITQSIDKSSQFQPVVTPVPTAVPTRGVTPITPMTPQPAQQTAQTPQPLFSQTPHQRRTPQPVMNSTPHSMPTTPSPFAGTPLSSKSAYNTANESQLSALELSWQQTEQKKQMMAIKLRQQTQNEIWKCVGTGHLDQAITKALNMKDPDMVVKICELFKENPSQLIDRIKSDQLVLISLLQQIIYNQTNVLMEETYWKTGFIEQIMTNLDLQNEFVIKILPGLAPKLIQQLDTISNSGAGPLADKAKILAFTFKHLRL